MLEWNVYVGDFNARKIREHNVFDHWRFLEDCRDNAKKNKNDRATFVYQLKNDLMYYYWSKSEWEIVVTSWPPRDNYGDIKIDVYDQVVMNWDKFADYVWEHKEEL